MTSLALTTHPLGVDQDPPYPAAEAVGSQLRGSKSVAPHLRLVPAPPDRSVSGFDLIDLTDPIEGTRVRAWHDADRWAEVVVEPMLTERDEQGPSDSAWHDLLRRSGLVPAARPTRPKRLVLVGSGPLAAEIALALPRGSDFELVMTPEAVSDQPRPQRWQRRMLAASARGHATARFDPAVLTLDAVQPAWRLQTVVIVACDTAEPDRALLGNLCTSGVEHVLVLAHRNRAQVGPWVSPGATPCQGCIDRAWAQRDPHYPAVLAQLCQRPAVVTQTLARWAAAELMAQLLRPDGGRTALAGRSHAFDLFNPHQRTQLWSARPGCPCGAAQPD